ncbi:hypothetical protein IJI76_01695 [Candidatus Saccharibacteria bacterium]|nr:hypothetical protein [Candidatus Saccharibacteria bacterium]
MNVLKIAADMKGSIQDATQNIPKNTDIDITAVLNWVYAFAGLVAAGFIVYGAVNYATAQGDPGKLKQASQTLAFAIIGLIVVLLAAAITNFVAGTASS